MIEFENEHDRGAVDRRHPAPSSTLIYVVAVVALSLVGVSSVVVLTVFDRERDHSATIMVILGFLVPTVTALLAGAVAQVQKSVNGRLSQLLAMTARTHAAEGELTGRQRASAELAALPEVTIAKVVAAPVVVPPTAPGAPAPTQTPTGTHEHFRADDVRGGSEDV